MNVVSFQLYCYLLRLRTLLRMMLVCILRRKVVPCRHLLLCRMLMKHVISASCVPNPCWITEGSWGWYGRAGHGRYGRRWDRNGGRDRCLTVSDQTAVVVCQLVTEFLHFGLQIGYFTLQRLVLVTGLVTKSKKKNNINNQFNRQSNSCRKHRTPMVYFYPMQYNLSAIYLCLDYYCGVTRWI